MDEKDSMMGEHTELQKQKAKLELDLADLSSELDGESSQKVIIRYLQACVVRWVKYINV